MVFCCKRTTTAQAQAIFPCSRLCAFWRACEKMCASLVCDASAFVCSSVKSASVQSVFPACAAGSQPLSWSDWASVGESSELRRSLVPHPHISSWTAHCMLCMFQCVCVCVCLCVHVMCIHLCMSVHIKASRSGECCLLPAGHQHTDAFVQD